jgi:hypothetical protein
MAGARFRLERLSRVSLRIAWGLASAMLLVLLIAIVVTPGTWAFPFAAIVFLAAATLATVILRMQADRKRLLSRMDLQAKLPDSILSAGDWFDEADGGPWRARQKADTLRQLEKIDWKQAWPVSWPRLLWLPLAASVFLMAVIGFVQMHWIEQQRQAQAVLAQENAPVKPEQLKPLEDVFKDWDEAQKIAPSPEMEQLLKDIKPLRDEMAAGKMTEKELFLKMNEVQARVQAEKDKMEAASLEPMAQSLAEAVKDLDSMSGLSAALQRKDFEAAKEQAAQAAEKYGSGAAKMPEGDKANAAASHLGEAAQKSSNDAQAASGMRQMQNSLSNKDGQEMSKGLSSLKNSLGQEAQRQGQCHNLGLQLSQLSSAKDGMGKGQGQGMKLGPPQLSLAKSLEEQKGAGTQSDPNREGPKTQLDANHQEMKITGTTGEGPSETHTESTQDPHNEQTASSVNSAQFAEYEKLSEQATQDENLPVADRQMIKKYFEDIRPQANP